MGYTATRDELEHIAALVHQERPQWDSTVVMLVLTAHVGQVDGTDLAIAALRCAKNSDYPTPKAIGWRGPHWRGLDTVPPAAQFRPRCKICSRTEPECYAVRPGKGDDHTFTPRDVAS
jgi:hypothetical protein